MTLWKTFFSQNAPLKIPCGFCNSWFALWIQYLPSKNIIRPVDFEKNTSIDSRMMRSGGRGCEGFGPPRIPSHYKIQDLPPSSFLISCGRFRKHVSRIISRTPLYLVWLLSEKSLEGLKFPASKRLVFFGEQFLRFSPNQIGILKHIPIEFDLDLNIG